MRCGAEFEQRETGRGLKGRSQIGMKRRKLGHWRWLLALALAAAMPSCGSAMVGAAGRRRASAQGAGSAARGPVDVATAVKKKVPGADRSARHRHADRQRRGQAAHRQRDHRSSFRRRRDRPQGDLLFTLDSRAIEAQIRQAEGIIGAPGRSSKAPSATSSATPSWSPRTRPRSRLNNAKTQVNIFAAAVESNDAQLENSAGAARLHPHPRADHRPRQHGHRQGRQLSCARPTRSRSQPSSRSRRSTSPSRCRRSLPELRQAIAEGSRSVEAIVPGEPQARGRTITMIENTVDAATGMVTVRATMPNENELLWPGTLVQAYLTCAARRR